MTARRKHTDLYGRGRYNLTPKFALDLYVTNGYGVTTGSSILSFGPGGDDPY